MLNRQGRPTQAGEAEEGGAGTFTGNRGLAIEEALIFEIGRTDTTGVDLEAPAKFSSKLGRHARTAPIDLPGLSEPETMRHYVRLSPEELRHRHRPVSARLVHDEAQPAPQREDGAAARLRRHPSAAAALDRAGRDRADRRAVALAAAR